MALNILDGNGAAKTLKTTLDGSDHVTHHRIDAVAGTVAATQSGTWNVIITGSLPAIEPGVGALNLGKAEDTAHTSGDVGTMALAVRNDAGVSLCGSDGDYVPLSTDSSGALRVTGGGGGTQYAEDSVHSSGHVGTMALAVRNDAGVSLCGSDGDYVPLSTDSTGRLFASVIAPAMTNSAGDGASVSGDTDHDAADAGEPINDGFRATTTLAGITLVANADRTHGYAGVDGAQIVRPHAPLEDIVTGNANNSDGTSTQCVAAGAAGIRHYITSICLTNTSASDIYVEIKDGTTVKLTLPLPAHGGCVFNPPVPIPGSAATAWNFDPSAAAATVFCSMIGFKSKV